MTKEEQLAELSRFEHNAPAAIRSGQNYDSFAREYGVSNTYRFRYSCMIDEYLEEERKRKQEEYEAKRLEREISKAMEIFE